MAIKYDKCLSDKYLSIKNHLGEIQCAVLYHFIKHDKERESILWMNVYNQIPDLVHKYFPSHFPEGTRFKWCDSWGAFRRLYRRGILCKVIIGEDAIIQSKLPKSKLKNRAWFVFNSDTKMEPRYTISPFLDMDLLTLIIEYKLNILINRFPSIYLSGYKF